MKHTKVQSSNIGWIRKKGKQAYTNSSPCLEIKGHIIVKKISLKFDSIHTHTREYMYFGNLGDLN